MLTCTNKLQVCEAIWNRPSCRLWCFWWPLPKWSQKFGILNQFWSRARPFMLHREVFDLFELRMNWKSFQLFHFWVDYEYITFNPFDGVRKTKNVWLAPCLKYCVTKSHKFLHSYDIWSIYYIYYSRTHHCLRNLTVFVHSQ